MPRDVFISYAHVDDEFDSTITPKGWVTALADRLGTKLAQKLGRREAVSIWRDDERLRRNEPFPTQIEQAIQGSAALVIVLSRGYLESEWCGRELATFLGAQGAEAVKRVFVVERDEAARLERPAALKDLLGYEFWKKVEGRSRTLGDPVVRPDRDTEYLDALESLSSELADALRAATPRRAAAAVATAVVATATATATVGAALTPPANPTVAAELARSAAPDDRPVVFLAWTTDDLNKRRREARQYLLQNKVRVVPESNYSLDRPDYEAAFHADAAQAKIFVQLISDEPGQPPPDVPEGFPALQLALARAEKMTLLRWRPTDLRLDDVDAQVRPLLEGDGMKVEEFEAFKDRVVKAAKALREPEALLARPSGESASVFVNCDQSDRALADQVAQALQDLGVSATLPLPDVELTKPDDKLRDVENCLYGNDTMICVYGQANLPWVRSQMHEARRASAQRPRPFAILGIYQDRPTPPKPDVGLRWRNVRVLSDPAQLSDFVRLLESNGGAGHGNGHGG